MDLPCGFAVWICHVDLPCASTLPSLPNVSQLCAERVQSVPVLICRICRICRICSRVSQLLLHTDSADQCGSVRISADQCEREGVCMLRSGTEVHEGVPINTNKHQ